MVYTGFYQATGWTIEWADSAMYTDFRVTVNGLNSNIRSVYYAFGLSNDQLMGDDDVINCIVNANGVATVQRLRNDVHATSPVIYLDSNNVQRGLSNIVASVTNGNLVCQFSRSKDTEGNSRIFDINNPYYLLTANSTLNANGKNTLWPYLAYFIYIVKIFKLY